MYWMLLVVTVLIHGNLLNSERGKFKERSRKEHSISAQHATRQHSAPSPPPSLENLFMSLRYLQQDSIRSYRFYFFTIVHSRKWINFVSCAPSCIETKTLADPTQSTRGISVFWKLRNDSWIRAPGFSANILQYFANNTIVIRRLKGASQIWHLIPDLNLPKIGYSVTVP